MSENEDELPECFVCTESVPVPRKSACKCTDRYVHDACLTKMLQQKTRAVCPVCAEPYTNVVTSSRVVGIKLESAGAYICLTMLAAAVMVVLGTILASTQLHRNLSHLEKAIVWGFSVGTFAFGIGAIAMAAYFAKTLGFGRLVQSAMIKKLDVRVVQALPDKMLVGVELLSVDETQSSQGRVKVWPC